MRPILLKCQATQAASRFPELQQGQEFSLGILQLFYAKDYHTFLWLATWNLPRPSGAMRRCCANFQYSSH